MKAAKRRVVRFISSFSWAYCAMSSMSSSSSALDVGVASFASHAPCRGAAGAAAAAVSGPSGSGCCAAWQRQAGRSCGRADCAVPTLPPADPPAVPWNARHGTDACAAARAAGLQGAAGGATIREVSLQEEEAFCTQFGRVLHRAHGAML